MAYWYKTQCDGCGLVLKDYDDEKRGLDDLFDRNKWDVRIDNHWWEPEKEGLIEQKKSIEFSADLCETCVKEVSHIIKRWLEVKKLNIGYLKD